MLNQRLRGDNLDLASTQNSAFGGMKASVSRSLQFYVTFLLMVPLRLCALDIDNNCFPPTPSDFAYLVYSKQVVRGNRISEGSFLTCCGHLQRHVFIAL